MQSPPPNRPARSYEFDYSYTVSGALQQMKYPARGTSRTIVTYQFDATGAQTGTGRLTGALRGDTGSTQKYADSLQYWAGGALKNVALGNTTTETTEIDGRGRMKSWQLLSGASNIVKLEFGYSAGGNVTQQTRTQGSTVIVTTYPSYDGVNRLKQVNEAGWSSARTYDYDRWGNIWMSGGPVGLHSATAKSAAYYNTATNRLVKRGPLGDPPNGPIDLPSGAYDAAGNLVSHLDLGVFQYDAEGRITQANAGSPTITTTYEYDGDGRRVRKIVAGGGTTVFVYDAFGQLALDEGPGTVTPETVYLTADHLGSTRYRRGASETGEKCYDYFPFGEALTTSRPGCFAADGAPAASVGGEWMRVRFTGQWRDWETSLDHFGARSYSAAVGRFTSPDMPLADQDEESPQSWNLLTYVRNNPMRQTDPTGRYVCDEKMGDACDDIEFALQGAQVAADGLKKKYGAKSKQYLAAQRAIDAYGKRGVDNGVFITLGELKKRAAGVDAGANRLARTAKNPLGQNIVVTFDSGEFGASRGTGILAATVAHEGSHVADASDWYRTGTNASLRDTEWDAYRVSAGTAEGLRLENLCYSSGNCVWRRDWTPEQTGAAIYRHVEASYGYNRNYVGGRAFPTKRTLNR